MSTVHGIRGVRDGRWFCECGQHWPVDPGAEVAPEGCPREGDS